MFYIFVTFKNNGAELYCWSWLYEVVFGNFLILTRFFERKIITATFRILLKFCQKKHQKTAKLVVRLILAAENQSNPVSWIAIYKGVNEVWQRYYVFYRGVTMVLKISYRGVRGSDSEVNDVLQPVW